MFFSSRAGKRALQGAGGKKSEKIYSTSHNIYSVYQNNPD